MIRRAQGPERFGSGIPEFISARGKGLFDSQKSRNSKFKIADYKSGKFIFKNTHKNAENAPETDRIYDSSN